MVAVIAKPLSDKKSYWLKYLHKGNANFTFPWYAWMIIGLVGFCVFMTFIIGFSIFSKKWRLYKARMILMQRNLTMKANVNKANGNSVQPVPSAMQNNNYSPLPNPSPG